MSPPLCIGVILLVFRPLGKIPLVKLKLKICDSGTLISLATALSSLVEISSISRLALGWRSFRMLMIVSGLVGCSSRFGVLFAVM